ncbi:MAG: hypothetical protein WDO14_19635 [Bacteroidota bacterium]
MNNRSKKGSFFQEKDSEDRKSYNSQYNNQYHRDNTGYRDYDDYNRRDHKDLSDNERRRRSRAVK